MKFYEVFVLVCFFFNMLYAEYAGPLKPRFYVCLDTYRNEAVCLMFVLRLYYSLLELGWMWIAYVGRQEYKQ